MQVFFSRCLIVNFMLLCEQRPFDLPRKGVFSQGNYLKLVPLCEKLVPIKHTSEQKRSCPWKNFPLKLSSACSALYFKSTGSATPRHCPYLKGNLQQFSRQSPHPIRNRCIRLVVSLLFIR